MKVIAYYLPQFHSVPENDGWWGEGFTEWTNTRAARPLWRGHHQPREPLDEHYYDLTDPAARQWQADLAAAHGVHGFCYYHYWFKGRRLLERPLEAVLESGQPRLPFCVAWANESWTRTWDGSEQHVLMQQDYGDEADWREHYRALRRYFADPRYLREGGRPMLLIYRAHSIPCLEPMLGLWREMAEADGLGGLYLIAVLSIFGEGRNPPAGFDAYQNFEPHTAIADGVSRRTWFWRNLRFRLRLLLGPRGILKDTYSYDEIWRGLLARRPRAGGVPEIPGGFVDWDNTARRKERATVLIGASPEKFRGYLGKLIRLAREVYSSDYVFVNAWNEWAEGAYLEPDQRHGLGYLQAVRGALEDAGELATESPAGSGLSASGAQADPSRL